MQSQPMYGCDTDTHLILAFDLEHSQPLQAYVNSLVCFCLLPQVQPSSEKAVEEYELVEEEAEIQPEVRTKKRPLPLGPLHKAAVISIVLQVHMPHLDSFRVGVFLDIFCFGTFCDQATAAKRSDPPPEPACDPPSKRLAIKKDEPGPSPAMASSQSSAASGIGVDSLTAAINASIQPAQQVQDKVQPANLTGTSVRELPQVQGTPAEGADPSSRSQDDAVAGGAGDQMPHPGLQECKYEEGYDAYGTWWVKDADDPKLYWYKKEGEPWGRWRDQTATWLPFFPK